MKTTEQRGFGTYDSLMIIVAGAALSVVLAIVGYWRYLPGASVGDVVFHAVNLLALNFRVVEGAPVPWELQFARLLVHLVAGAAIGLAFVTLARRRLDRRRAQRWNDHVVVLGSSQRAVMVAERYRMRDERVVLVGDPGEAAHLSLQGQGVRVIDVSGQLLARVIKDAKRLIVVGHGDEETVRLRAALTASTLEIARSVQVIVDRPDLAEELDGSVGGLRTGVDVCCVSQRVAAAVLRDHPPEDEGTAAPPPVVIGQGVLAEELVRRLVRGWYQPGAGREVLLLSPQPAAFDDLREELSGLGLVVAGPDVWSPRRVVSRVASHARERAPSPQRRPMRQAQGPLVLLAGLEDAQTVTLAAKLARQVPEARVVALLDEVSGWDQLPDPKLAEGAGLILMSVRAHATDPQVIETDRPRLLARELFADQRRWRDDVPSIFGDHVRRVPSFEDLAGEDRRRFDQVSAAALEACHRQGLVPATSAARPLMLLPSELTAIVADVRAAVGDLPAVADADDYVWLEFAAHLPSLLARTGTDLARTRDPEVSFGEAEVAALAPLAHQCYLDTQQAAGNLTASEVADQAWEELSEFHYESNRQQVRDIPVKLAGAGCTLRRLADGEQPDESWLTEEVVERLAVWEHRRWEYLHRLAGYRYGPQTDHAARLHSQLIPWQNLERAKELDKAAVRAIPGMLAAVGLDSSTQEGHVNRSS